MVGEGISFFFDYIERFAEPEFFLAVFFLENNHFKAEVFAEAIGIDDCTCCEITASCGVCEVGSFHVKYFYAIPRPGDFFFPCHNLFCQGIIIGDEFLRPFRLLVVEAGNVVFNHSGHGEMGGYITDRTFDILHPFRRISLGVFGKIKGDNLIFKHRIDCCCIEFVLLCLVCISAFVCKSPASFFIKAVTFIPPSVEH